MNIKIKKELEQIKVSRDELMQILQVSDSALKQIIKRKCLSDRLFEKGYIFENKIKEGRKSYFILKKYAEDKELLNNIIVNLFNTKEEEKFINYYFYRLFNIRHRKPVSKELLSQKVNVNRKTITKWDDKMLEHKIISKDGYFYISLKLDKEGNKTYNLTDRFEYNAYVKNSKFVKKRKDAMIKWKNNEIDDDTFKIIYDGTTLEALAIEGKFVYKISKYQIEKDSELGKQILRLIVNTYKTNKYDYIISFLPSEE